VGHPWCHLSCFLTQGKHQDYAVVQIQICNLYCSKKKQRLCRNEQDSTMTLKVWLDTDQHAAELPLLLSAAAAQHVLDQRTGSSVACLSGSHAVCRTQRRRLSWLCHGFGSCISTRQSVSSKCCLDFVTLYLSNNNASDKRVLGTAACSAAILSAQITFWLKFAVDTNCAAHNRTRSQHLIM